MSTKALREVLETYEALLNTNDTKAGKAARAELEAIEKAAKDLTRLHLGDGVYDVRRMEHVVSAPGDPWEHPDVKAWGEAATLMETISKGEHPASGAAPPHAVW